MIALDDIGIHLGTFALEGVSFAVPTGTYAVLMGPTGSGKTTLLEIIAGLRHPDRGRVQLADRDVSRLRPGERGVGYVPQDGALFPNLSVGENLAFALRVRGWNGSRLSEQTGTLAKRLQIPHLLDRSIDGLSGGERQRVALGRAIAFDPQFLLLDEPLAALDESTREDMMTLLAEIHRERGTSVLHATHSRTEAERLGQLRLVLNREGKIEHLRQDSNLQSPA